jgi:hypothetical protein
MEDIGDNLKVIRPREDLHGRPASQVERNKLQSPTPISKP